MWVYLSSSDGCHQCVVPYHHRHVKYLRCGGCCGFWDRIKNKYVCRYAMLGGGAGSDVHGRPKYGSKKIDRVRKTTRTGLAVNLSVTLFSVILVQILQARSLDCLILKMWRWLILAFFICVYAVLQTAWSMQLCIHLTPLRPVWELRVWRCLVHSWILWLYVCWPHGF